MQAEREAVAGGVDRLADLCQAVPGKSHHVQDGTEYLAFQHADRRNFVDGRRDIAPMCVLLAQGQVEQLARLLAHSDLVGFERSARVLVDEWTDIGGIVERIVYPEFASRPEQDRKSTRLNSSHMSISYA